MVIKMVIINHNIQTLIIFITILIIVSSRRQYLSNRGFENSYFKGSYFVDSSRIHGQKYYQSRSNQITRFLNDSNNSTLNELFNQHLYYQFNEKLKNQITSGIPILNIPSLDPLKIDQIKLTPLIGSDPFQIILTNFKIEGLSKYIIKDISSRLNELRFKMTLMFPNLEANCAYSVNGTLYDVFETHGAGLGKIEYFNVLVRININLNFFNESLSIASVDPPFVDYSRSIISLKSTDGQISSNDIVSELGPILFWMLADELVEAINQYSSTYLNHVLKTFKLPSNFKPTITWLIKRASPTFKPLLPVFLFSNLFNVVNDIKSQINVPLLIENLKNIPASLRTSIKKLI